MDGPCGVDPLTPHFYIVKLGFTRVFTFFLMFALNIDCGYSLVITIYVLSKMRKISIKSSLLQILKISACYHHENISA